MPSDAVMDKSPVSRHRLSLPLTTSAAFTSQLAEKSASPCKLAGNSVTGKSCSAIFSIWPLLEKVLAPIVNESITALPFASCKVAFPIFTVFLSTISIVGAVILIGDTPVKSRLCSIPCHLFKGLKLPCSWLDNLNDWPCAAMLS